MSLAKVSISGVGWLSDFAWSASDAVTQVEKGSSVGYKSVFNNTALQNFFGFDFDPCYAPLKDAQDQLAKAYKKSGIKDSRVASFINVVEQCLEDAGLDRRAMANDDLQVIWAAPGNQPDLKSFYGHLAGNEKLDLLLNPRLKELHSQNFRNDSLTIPFANYFSLKHPLTTIFSACSSTLSALVPAKALIQSGRRKRVLVLSWQDISTFDVLFMAGINILSRKNFEPFSQQSDGINPAFGISALLLESEEDINNRSGSGHYNLRSIRAGRAFSGSQNSPSMSVPFRSIVKNIEALLEQSELSSNDIDLVYPHGNGLKASDQAEAMAIEKLFSSSKPYVANYTGQTGYLLASSGGFDLTLACDVFKNNRILPFSSNENIDYKETLNFVNEQTVNHDVRYLLKNSVGIDGSIVSCILERPGSNYAS